MKSFTQRWRDASDEAEDQPMEDTPTDSKEAQDEPEGEDCNHADECGFCRARKSLLEDQTERADRLQAEAENLSEALGQERAMHNVALAKLQAELDAVRKERDEWREQHDTADRSHFRVLQERDAAQAKCAELEKDLIVTEAARRKWVDAAHDRRMKMEELERLASKAIHSLTKTLSNESLRNDSVERATVLFDAQRSSDKMRALLTPAPPEEKRP